MILAVLFSCAAAAAAVRADRAGLCLPLAACVEAGQLSYLVAKPRGLLKLQFARALLHLLREQRDAILAFLVGERGFVRFALVEITSFSWTAFFTLCGVMPCASL